MTKRAKAVATAATLFSYEEPGLESYHNGHGPTSPSPHIGMSHYKIDPIIRRPANLLGHPGFLLFPPGASTSTENATRAYDTIPGSPSAYIRTTPMLSTCSTTHSPCLFAFNTHTILRPWHTWPNDLVFIGHRPKYRRETAAGGCTFGARANFARVGVCVTVAAGSHSLSARLLLLHLCQARYYVQYA